MNVVKRAELAGHGIRYRLTEHDGEAGNIGTLPVEVVLQIASRLSEPASLIRLRLLSKQWNRILQSPEVVSYLEQLSSSGGRINHDCLLMLYKVVTNSTRGNQVLQMLRLMVYRPSLKAWSSSLTMQPNDNVFPAEVAFGCRHSGRFDLPAEPLVDSSRNGSGGLICCGELAWLHESMAYLKHVVIVNLLTGMQTRLPRLPSNQIIMVDCGRRNDAAVRVSLVTGCRVSLAIRPDVIDYRDDGRSCLVFLSLHATDTAYFSGRRSACKARKTDSIHQLFVYKYNEDDSLSSENNVNRWLSVSDFRIRRVKNLDLERFIAAADLWNFHGRDGLFYLELFKFHYGPHVSMNSYNHVRCSIKPSAAHVPTFWDSKAFKWKDKLVLLVPQGSPSFPHGFTVYELKPTTAATNNNNNNFSLFHLEWVEVSATPPHFLRRIPNFECHLAQDESFHIEFVVSGNLAYMIRTRHVPCSGTCLALSSSIPYLVYDLYNKSWYVVPPPPIRYPSQLGFLPFTY